MLYAVRSIVPAISRWAAHRESTLNRDPVTQTSSRLQLRPSHASHLIILAFGLAVASRAFAQSNPSVPDAPTPQTSVSAQASAGERPTSVRGAFMDVLHDELRIVTSPARIHKNDLKFLVPVAGAVTTTLLTDTRTMTTVVSHDQNFNQLNISASNALVGGSLAAPVALFGIGEFSHRPYARDSGILGAEAMVDSIIVVEATKLIFLRERPYDDQARGVFFVPKSGPGSSFASSHSVLAWSSAAVIADRYRSPWIQAGVYTLATGVSMTRVLGYQHFPTDVLVGGVTGWLIGHYVSRSHGRHAEQ